MRIQTMLTAGFLVAASSGAWAQETGLGVNTHVPDDGMLDLCADLGVNWIRVDGNWDLLNPASGTFNWALDDAVNGARTRNMEVFMTLGYTPDWVPRVARTRSDTYNGNDEPLTSTEWIAFVEAAVAHYQPLGVTHYGLWNEANLGGFWEEAAGSQSWIDKILVPGAAAVKRVCPTCKVLGPELAHVGEYQNFMRPVLMQAGDVYDIITHHSYNGWAELGLQIWDGDSFLNAIETRRFSFTRPALKELLDEFNITVPVWITETGLKAAPAGDVNQENRQAQYIELVMDAQLARPW